MAGCLGETERPSADPALHLDPIPRRFRFLPYHPDLFDGNLDIARNLLLFIRGATPRRCGPRTQRRPPAAIVRMTGAVK